MNNKFDVKIINNYFKDVKKYDLLSVEEEIEICNRIKNGDKKAAEILINANLKFVVSIAKLYQGCGLPLEDLISEGNVGLMKAVGKFDNTIGVKFTSYAVWWIRQSILFSLGENARTIRLPFNIINKLNELKKELVKNSDEIDEDVLNELNRFNNLKCSSINEVINEDGDEVHNLISEDDDSLAMDFDTKFNLNKTVVSRVLSILSERERDIVKTYFGIDKEHDGSTLEHIGEKYNLSKERVRQIKEKAIKKLRYGIVDYMNLVKENG